MTKYFNKKQKGFTLVEMMVAIAVFSVVMVVAATALLSIIDANKKSQAIKTAINNLNFALEGISKDVRMGTNYQCLDDTADSNGNCPGTGGQSFKYRSTRAYKSNGIYGFAYYRYDPTTQSIQSCLEKTSDIDCSLDSNFFPLTSEEIRITNAKFYIVGNGSELDIPKLQPRVVIIIEGESGNQAKIKTTFDLQTSVSQRTRFNN